MTLLEHLKCILGMHAWFVYAVDRVVCVRCGHRYVPRPQPARFLRGRDRG